VKGNSITFTIIVVIIVLILTVGVAIFAFQYGQQTAANNPSLETGVVALATTAVPPQIITNTPTSTTTPTPTTTQTPTPTLTPTFTPTPTPTPIVVITHVNDLGRLETTEFAMRTVIDLQNESANLWQDLFGSDGLMLIAEGEVVAGFDLEQVTEENITVQGKSVQIILPAPEILYSRIDNERTYVYERKTGLLVPPDQTLEGRARQLAEESLVEWAIERNIFEAAETAGRLKIENLLRSLGFTEIEIIVEDKDI
jgi:hypothetical protein